MDREDLITDDRYATHGQRGTHAHQLDELIAAWTSTLPANDLLALLAGHGVPSGKVFTAADVLADPHYLARGMVQRLTSSSGVSMPVCGIVPKFAVPRARFEVPVPPRGAQPSRDSYRDSGDGGSQAQPTVTGHERNDSGACL